MKRFLLLLLVLLGLSGAALAQDVCTADASQTRSLTCPESYLRLVCELPDEVPVTVSITDESGVLHYQRDYGLCSGSFRSEEIYLRLTGSRTAYEVAMQAGDTRYAFPVTRVMPWLTDSEACSAGFPLRALAGVSSWKNVTMLDVNALEGSSLTVPICASGAYVIGQVTFSVRGGELTVSARLDGSLDGTLDAATVCVATDAISAGQLDTRRFSGVTGSLDEALPLFGTPYAAVLVDMTVSFDPGTASSDPPKKLDDQHRIWELMQETTANEAVG